MFKKAFFWFLHTKTKKRAISILALLQNFFSPKLSTSEQTNKTKANESAARAHPWRGFWLRVTNTFQLPTIR